MNWGLPLFVKVISKRVYEDQQKEAASFFRISFYTTWTYSLSCFPYLSNS